MIGDEDLNQEEDLKEDLEEDLKEDWNQGEEMINTRFCVSKKLHHS